MDTSQQQLPDNAQPPEPVTLTQAFWYWLKLGFISFGGPAGQIAIMHQDLVEKKRWISERRFLHALNYCMVLPGPEAQQLAVYIGWLMHRTWGGIIAGTLFVLPSLFILIFLSWIYLAFGNVPAVAGILYGIKPAVTAIVLFAAYRIGSRALKHGVLWAMAAAAFLAIFAFDVPFPAIVLAAGLIGYAGGRVAPEKFATGGGHGMAKDGYGAALIDDDTPTPEHARFSWARLLRVALAGVAIWAAAMLLLVAQFGWQGAVHADGLVLHQGRVADFRRRLRGVALCLSGCGRTLPLADPAANDGRAGIGRDHAGAADHGGGIRRFRRRLEPGTVRPGRIVFLCRECRDGGDVLHISAVVHLHFSRRAAGGKHARRSEIHRAAHRHHSGSGRRDTQPGGVLRLPCDVAARFQGIFRVVLRAAGHSGIACAVALPGRDHSGHSGVRRGGIGLSTGDVMKQTLEWNTEALLRSPLFAPLHPVLAELESGDFPTLDDCNALLAAHHPPITVSSGAPLRFVAQQRGKLSFESAI